MLPKLGIIAGKGKLPGYLINSCKLDRRDFFVVAIEGQANPKITKNVPHIWADLKNIGGAFRELKDRKVKEVVMAGSVKRPSFFEIKPDFITAKVLKKIIQNTLLGKKTIGDGKMFSFLIQAIEELGFKVVGLQRILVDALAKKGIYGKCRPDNLATQDIETGVKIARSIGKLDIGQSVIVQQGTVVGVEAAEGTDDLIKRFGKFKLSGDGGVLVKIGKPHQDKRVDLPTIGMDTVRNSINVGLKGIAIEERSTIIIDKEKIIPYANRNNFFLIGV
tara:strand:- start:583 stop:1410 length:828 start_codon:yes stop_codon:yes gene_type:complete